MWEEVWNRKDRTLLLLIPTAEFARQEPFVRQLPHVRVVDWRKEFLQTLRPDQRFLNLRVQSELDRLKVWVKSNEGSIICVINTEYALSRFDPNERQLFWRGLWLDFPYCTSIVVFSVLDSPELLPCNLEQWRASRRLVNPDEFAGGGTDAQDD
jgi:hypothetical protein